MILIDIIIAVFLGGLLICVICVTALLFKYVTIFNNIYENTEAIKYRTKALDRGLSQDELDEFAKTFDNAEASD